MHSNQLIDNEEALRLFFNDDVYLVGALPNHVAKPILAQQNETVYAEKTAKTEIVSLPKVEEPTTDYTANFDFKYLGKNEKSILILVNDATNAVSTPQGTELLRKLVLSINLKNADFALVNYSNYTNAKFEHLQNFFNPKLVLSFGVATQQLGLPVQLLHQLAVNNDIKMIFTHNLHDLDADLNAKKALWGTLKKL